MKWAVSTENLPALVLGGLIGVALEAAVQVALAQPTATYTCVAKSGVPCNLALMDDRAAAYAREQQHAAMADALLRRRWTCLGADDVLACLRVVNRRTPK